MQWRIDGKGIFTRKRSLAKSITFILRCNEKKFKILSETCEVNKYSIMLRQLYFETRVEIWSGETPGTRGPD